MQHPQPAPNLRHVCVEGKDAASEIVKQPAKPTVERLRLPDVASMPHELDPAPQFADRHGRESPDAQLLHCGRVRPHDA